MTSSGHRSRGNSVLIAIVSVVVLYLLSAAIWGHPQYATSLVVGAASNHSEHSEPSHEEGHDEATAPPVWTVLPFVLLLGAIAVFPLLHATEHWWESNASRFKVAAGLALITLCYYAFIHDAAVESHWPVHSSVAPSESAIQTGFVGAMLGNALLAEYIPFIVLLFSLYSIAGGIRIEGDLRADPLTNAAFMGVGGLLASFVGTTGAAMLLIRPLLETNKERKHVSHTIVFFIFVVCNCGGCLLPIGDPPLFLGYLEGVSFFWTLTLWRSWLLVNGLLLLVYCLIDQLYFYRQETIRDIKRDISQTRKLKISGLALNGPLLLGVVMAVALLDPRKAVPGTDWHAWMFLREVVQLALVALSLHFGSKKIREANNFNFAAIVEVAALFIGIFVCMQPALQILTEQGDMLAKSLGPGGYFWATGALSSFLDNAPTYLVFFKTAQDPTMIHSVTAGVPEIILKAISLGAVFMGAMTYIGNGPNFMVKAIAEKSGVRMPSFFGYMGYSCLILLPIMLLNQWQNLSHVDGVPHETGNTQVAAPVEDH
ncbi:sodium:proton antiporter [Bythopirellula polymerisocia]|nr:sodium:proton antiporter [Bythopirellula polymerisocia]